MTTIVVATLTPRDDFRADVVANLASLVSQVHAEAGCELYAIHDAEDGTIVMIEKWATREHLDAHSRGAVVARIRTANEGLLEKEPEVLLMRPLTMGDDAKGLL